MSEEEEGFAGVVTAALNALLLGLETRLDACLGSLMRCNWAATESVSASLCLLTAPSRWCPMALNDRGSLGRMGPSDSLSPADQSCVVGWRFQEAPPSQTHPHKGPSRWAQTGWAVMISAPSSCLDPARRSATGRHYVTAMGRALQQFTD